MDFEKCTVCNEKSDEDNYKKDRNICKNCYNLIRKIYNNKTFSGNDNNKKNTKVVNSVKIQILIKRKEKSLPL